MNRAVPLTIAAGVLAVVMAAGSAQAATANTGILGKLNAAAQSSSQVEKAGWRHRRHHRRCFRRCMHRTDGAYWLCKRRCHRWW